MTREQCLANIEAEMTASRRASLERMVERGCSTEEIQWFLQAHQQQMEENLAAVSNIIAGVELALGGRR